MRLNDSAFIDNFTLEAFLRNSEKNLITNFPLDCALKLSESKEPFVIISNEYYPLSFYNTNTKEHLISFLQSSTPILSSIIDYNKSKDNYSIIIQVFTFSSQPIYFDRLEIGIDPYILQELKKLFPGVYAKQNIYEWLSEEFILEYGENNKQYCLINPRKKEAIGFSLFGRNLVIEVKLQNDKYLIEKIHRSRNKIGSNQLSLVECSLEFKNIDEAGSVSSVSHTELEKIFDQSNGYLELWDKYNFIELKNTINKQIELGYFKYTSFYTVPRQINSYAFCLKDIEDSNSLQQIYNSRDLVEISSKIPKYDENLKFQDRDPGEAKPVMGEIKEVGKELIIQIEEEKSKIPDSGFIYLSIRGDRKRIKRREEASQVISSNRAKIPNLAQLIEGLQPPIFRTHKFHSQSVERAILEVFEGTKPNSSQIQAIKAALNTPDLAIILGPPGTGKTKVIRAIAKAFHYESQIENSSAVSNANILFTSESHDAVSNMIKDTYVMGLPALKVDGDSETNEEIIKTFSDKIINQLRSHDDFKAESDFENIIYEIIHITLSFLQLAFEPELLIKILKDLLGKLQNVIDSGNLVSLRNTIYKIENLLSSSDNLSKDEKRLYHFFKQIKERANGSESITEDDVKNLLIRVQRVNTSFYDQLSSLSDNSGIIKEIDKWYTGKTPAQKLIDLKDDILKALTNIQDELTTKEANSGSSLGNILRDFYNSIESNPKELESTILEYVQVIGTTAQGSAKSIISEYKKDDTNSYEAVIVDEAARVNPLDLFIPLSKAKRFILVGDDNQLPHMLDPEIEKDLLITKQEVRQAYKDSLFFRLKNTAITRSSIDGNTRVVQLDEQYRMHPEIGSMISEVFYNGTVKNGIPRELTEHNIEEFMGKQFVWLDVPYSQGRETPGRSKSRLAEANVVSEITRLILGKNTCYSLGIITFYTEQRNLIINALKKDGVLEAEENLRLMPNYRGQLGNSRLKIGTVDAFQGQEFDIVILSLTRSNKDKLESLEDRIIRAKYGFLCSSNRQNVAFSRGKRLLITIGDLEMFSNDLLKNAMPGFYSLVSKCGGPNGSIVKL